MATIAIGDIHGNQRQLDDLLARVVPELRPEDTLVFLGDYIDRGPDSKGCLERILRLKLEAQFEVVTLLGNHEQWMLRSLKDPMRHSWLLAMEGMDTVKSYSAEAAEILARSIEDYGPRLFFYKVALPTKRFFVPCRGSICVSSKNSSRFTRRQMWFASMRASTLTASSTRPRLIFMYGDRLVFQRNMQGRARWYMAIGTTQSGM